MFVTLSSLSTHRYKGRGVRGTSRKVVETKVNVGSASNHCRTTRTNFDGIASKQQFIVARSASTYNYNMKTQSDRKLRYKIQCQNLQPNHIQRT